MRTVARDTPSFLAIEAVSRPSTSNARHWRSRPVRKEASRLASSVARGWRWRGGLGTSTTTSPRSTRLIAAVSAVTPRVLCR